MNKVDPPSPPVTRELARFVAEAETARPHLLDLAAIALLDWMGVTLAGTRQAASAQLRKTIAQFAGPAQATIIGCGERTDVVSASLLNGFASHLLDYDDVDMSWIGHPSVPVFPALLAIAELEGSTGGEVLDAYIIGTEIQHRIGRSVMPDHYTRGWHSTATIGTFGAAAGVARLLKLNPSQIAAALGIAGTSAAGLRLMFGTMCKPLHPGRAAANGIMAAMLARDGFTSVDHVIEGPGGFADVLTSSFAPGKVTDDLGLRWAVEQIEFKAHAACKSTHGAINCALALREKVKERLAEIESLDFRIAELALKIAGIDRPQTALEAKFCQRYCIAVALLDGSAGLAQFHDSRVADPLVRALMDRIKVSGDPSIDYDAASAVVHFTDGTTLHEEFFKPGRPADTRVTRQIARNKFLAIAADLEIDMDANHLADLILNVVDHGPMNELIGCLPTVTSASSA